MDENQTQEEEKLPAAFEDFELTQEEVLSLQLSEEVLLRIKTQLELAATRKQHLIEAILKKYEEGDLYEVSPSLNMATRKGQRRLKG